MPFFSSLCGGICRQTLILLIFVAASPGLFAQTDTNTAIPAPGEISLTFSTNGVATNAPAGFPIAAPAPETNAPAPASIPVARPVAGPLPTTDSSPLPQASGSTFGALLTFASIAGFLLYYCGLTRAKNSSHTSMLLLIGVVFGLTGYWIFGFAVQDGGVGDTHAALAQPIPAPERSSLNHEVGPVLFSHHWGLMGSSGFFMVTDDSARDGAALLFLNNAGLLAIVVLAALGAALERGKLLPMACCAYLIAWLVYPPLANWVWGGGWLAELGREFGLGHGYVDVSGSGVVHETAGILALVLAIVLGPRHGRFGRNKPSHPIPGHNVPFIVIGAAILLVSWMSTNAFAAANISTDGSGAALAAITTLLAAMGGLVTSYVQASWQKSRPDPARLCRGLLGGAVASCGGAGLLDPWAAFLIGCVAALLVQQAMIFLEQKRIDDPVGAAAVHGAGGIWGVLAVGFFANGATGDGLNGVANPVRGLFFGGAWHQLAAQVLGCVTGFVVICILGYALISLVQKILGTRVELADETSGLDWNETGAFGYQGDVEPEENVKS